MVELILAILAQCRTAGIHCGLHCGSPEYAARMASKGFAMVTVGSDARFVEAGASAAVGKFRSLIKG